MLDVVVIVRREGRRSQVDWRKLRGGVVLCQGKISWQVRARIVRLMDRRGTYDRSALPTSANPGGAEAVEQQRSLGHHTSNSRTKRGFGLCSGIRIRATWEE